MKSHSVEMPPQIPIPIICTVNARKEDFGKNKKMAMHPTPNYNKFTTRELGHLKWYYDQIFTPNFCKICK